MFSALSFLQPAQRKTTYIPSSLLLTDAPPQRPALSAELRHTPPKRPIFPGGDDQDHVQILIWALLEVNYWTELASGLEEGHQTQLHGRMAEQALKALQLKEAIEVAFTLKGDKGRRLEQERCFQAAGIFLSPDVQFALIQATQKIGGGGLKLQELVTMYTIAYSTSKEFSSKVGDWEVVQRFEGLERFGYHENLGDQESQLMWMDRFHKMRWVLSALQSSLSRQSWERLSTQASLGNKLKTFYETLSLLREKMNKVFDFPIIDNGGEAEQLHKVGLNILTLYRGELMWYLEKVLNREENEEVLHNDSNWKPQLVKILSALPDPPAEHSLAHSGGGMSPRRRAIYEKARSMREAP